MSNGYFDKGKWIENESGYHITPAEHDNRVETLKRLQGSIEILNRINLELCHNLNRYRYAGFFNRLKFLITGRI
jgi:hypothetical protein